VYSSLCIKYPDRASPQPHLGFCLPARARAHLPEPRYATCPGLVRTPNHRDIYTPGATGGERMGRCIPKQLGDIQLSLCDAGSRKPLSTQHTTTMPTYTYTLRIRLFIVHITRKPESQHNNAPLWMSHGFIATLDSLVLSQAYHINSSLLLSVLFR